MIKVGEIFSHWKILEKAKAGYVTCLCLGCNQTTRKVSCYNLRNNVSKSCGCKTKELTEQTMLSRYGVKNAAQDTSFLEKGRQTSFLKYGKEYFSQTPEFINQIKKTNQIRYGADYAIQNNEFKEKRKQTCLEKYDTENPAQALEFEAKKQQTNIKKYGVTHPFKLKTFREKAQQTNLERYGHSHIGSSPDHKIKRKKSLEINGYLVKTSDGRLLSDICKEYNVLPSYAYKVFHFQGEEAFLKYCINYQDNIFSSTEGAFINLMKDFELNKYDRQPKEFCSPRYRPDFRVERQNKVLYVNTDGLYWHSVSQKLDKNYHLSLQQTLLKNKLTIFQFREDELRNSSHIIKSIVLNYFNMHTTKYSARSLNIKPTSTKEASLFFINNHLMGAHKSARAYGLYTRDNVLTCCISVRHNKKDNSIEIARFGSLLNSSVRGGFSKLLKYVEHIYQSDRVISFCDLRYSTGTSYNKLGFTLEKITLGWKWTDSKNTFNRLQCRANMDERKLTQEKYANELGWVKIYDAGQAKYIKENSHDR